MDNSYNKASRKRKLRFLIVAEDKYPPFRVDVVVLFAQQMTSRGHKIDWILQSEGECDEAKQVEWDGCTVYVGATNLGESRLDRIKKHILDLRNDLNMFNLARKNQYDFIQVKDKFLSSILAILAAKKNKTKFIFWLSYPFPEASIYEAKAGTARYPSLYLIRGKFFKWLLYKVITRQADHVFVQSEQMKRDVIAEGVHETKTTAVPMGIAKKLFDYTKTYSSPNEKLKGKSIVYLGTLLKTRKLDFVIRVLAKVLEKEPKAILYMVGPEEQEGDLEILRNEANKLNIMDKLVFTGRLPQTEALKYVINSDICISPFYPTPILNSTSPTKLIEYMALKKPVVANDHPEQSLVIRESGAGICVPYEVDAFADAIIKILTNRAMAQEMGEKGHEYAKRYRTYDYLADEVEQKYLEIVGGNPPPCHSQY